MDRNRMAAWIASVGNHPHAPYLQTLLGEYDNKTKEAEINLRNFHAALEAKTAAEKEAQQAKHDAARLADWIIHHPSGSDPTEVLTMHDRAMV